MSNTDENGSREDWRQKWEAEKLEKEKLQTRLKGYETVAKLASDKEHENRVLKKRLEGLQSQRGQNASKSDKETYESPLNEPEVTSHGVETTDKNLHQGLTDLSTSVSSPNSTQGGSSSSSFMVLGKNSRDVHGQNNGIPVLQSLASSCGKKSHEDEFLVVSHPDKNGTVIEKESTLERSPVISSMSPNHLKEEKPRSNFNTFDEYIQVFPQTSLSGGSNFTSSTDSRVGGSPSCMNSSRQGPTSMLVVGTGSMPSYHYVEVKNGELHKDDKPPYETSGTVVQDALPTTGASSYPDLFSGTGARPKAHPAQSKKSVGDDESGETELNKPTANLDDATNLMVKIPNENSTSYRINNAPMLAYGRMESQTEISALTSFGSYLPSLSSQKVQKGNSESGKYNNLNMVGGNAQPDLQEKNTEEFVVVESVPPIAPSTNPIIPPVKPKSEEMTIREANTALRKELESVRRKMTQLHQANKEWKDRWDTLQKQKDDELTHLHTQVKNLTHERDRLKRESDHHITSLKEELNNMIASKKDTENAYVVLVSGRSQEKQLLEKLKQDYGTLHQEKRALEIQLEGAQALTHSPQVRPAEIPKTNFELETELAVVTRQVTLFMEDFNKEHKERQAVEKTLQKEKEAHQALETKLRRTHALLKSRDEDLRQKTKQVSDLQFQVEDLKLKLEVEQRRASIYPSMDIPAQEATNLEVSFDPEPVAAPGKSQNIGTRSHNLNVHSLKPERWSCCACTYENKMSHKTCDICGTPSTGTARFIELN